MKVSINIYKAEILILENSTLWRTLWWNQLFFLRNLAGIWYGVNPFICNLFVLAKTDSDLAWLIYKYIPNAIKYHLKHYHQYGSQSWDFYLQKAALYESYIIEISLFFFQEICLKHMWCKIIDCVNPSRWYIMSMMS